MEIHSPYVDESTARGLLCGVAGVFLLYFVFNLQIISQKPIPGFEIVGREDGDWTLRAAQKRFNAHSKELITEGLKRSKGKVIQFVNHVGPQLVLPPQFIHEIRNNPHMDMHGISKNDFFTDYAAFKAMRAGERDNIILKMVNRKLTTSLALITGPVNEENTIAIPKHWPEVSEWTSTPIVEKTMLLTSQVTSRIFLGAPLCRDEKWIAIARDWTMELMIAAYCMRALPSILRPILYYLLPPIYKLQKTVKEATKIIQPEVDRRRKNRADALARGEKIPKHLDSIEWLDEIAPPDYDFVGGQLTLTFVAIHTTSNTLAYLMFDLIDNPELIPELRAEIVAALREDGGFLKTTLYKMRLLDSVLKESQRINVLGNLIMQRQIHQDVTLSDGTVLPKGSRVHIPSVHMNDEEYYPNPTKFDGKRWMRLRDEPGNASRFQFVTTTPEHIGFGHGEHSCPGRFFASNEIKMIACHLLLKFDWAFKDGVRPPKKLMGSEYYLDPKAEVLYRSRVPEIDLANIQIAE